MKKILGVIFLGLLLSGCVTPQSVDQQKAMFEKEDIKIGMLYFEVKDITGTGWSTSDKLFKNSSQIIDLRADSYEVVPRYIFEQKDPEKQIKGVFGGDLSSYKLIHVFFDEIKFYKYLTTHELSSDTEKVQNLATLKYWLSKKNDLKKAEEEIKKIEDGDSESKPKTTSDDNDEISGATGTAFFIDNNGHMITNHHVIAGCKDRSQISYNNENIKAKLIATDKTLDLALLKADVKNNNFINISTTPPKKLKRIIVAGYPFGLDLSNDLKFNSGIITSLKGLGDDSTRIQIDAAINFGNSGGPIVYEENGELAAVAVAGLSKDKTEAVNFGIKASSVKNFLQSNQIDLTLVKQKFNFGNDDLAELLESSTLYTFCE